MAQKKIQMKCISVYLVCTMTLLLSLLTFVVVVYTNKADKVIQNKVTVNRDRQFHRVMVHHEGIVQNHKGQHNSVHNLYCDHLHVNHDMLLNFKKNGFTNVHTKTLKVPLQAEFTTLQGEFILYDRYFTSFNITKTTKLTTKTLILIEIDIEFECEQVDLRIDNDGDDEETTRSLSVGYQIFTLPKKPVKLICIAKSLSSSVVYLKSLTQTFFFSS